MLLLWLACWVQQEELGETGLVSEGDTDTDTDTDTDSDTGETGCSGVWYRDEDGDGYGNSDLSSDACEAPEGYVAVNGDCNDQDPGYNPGARDPCRDGVDRNCDGQDPDACTPEGLIIAGDGSHRLWTSQVSSSYFGASVALGDVDGDEQVDQLVGTIEHTPPDGPGRVDVWSALAEGEPSFTLNGDVDLGRFGYRLDIGDPGDGAVLLVASGTYPWDGSATEARGKVWVYDLPLGAGSSPSQTLEGSYGGDYFGGMVEAGPVSLVGAHLVDTDRDGCPEGELRVWTDGSFTLASPDTVIQGRCSSVTWGMGFGSLGDVDGDGAPDLAWGRAATADLTGSAQVLLDVRGHPGTVTSEDADVSVLGANEGDRAGHVVRLADVDGDGYAELLVAARDAQGGTGVVYLLEEHAVDGTIEDQATATWVGTAPQQHGYFGSLLTDIGDLDGDGLEDIAISESTWGEPETGRTDGRLHVFHGAVDLSGVEEADLLVQGPDNDNCGLGADAADVDGDGFSELAVTCWQSSLGGPSFSGAVLLIGGGGPNGL